MVARNEKFPCSEADAKSLISRNLVRPAIDKQLTSPVQQKARKDKAKAALEDMAPKETAAAKPKKPRKASTTRKKKTTTKKKTAARGK